MGIVEVALISAVVSGAVGYSRNRKAASQQKESNRQSAAMQQQEARRQRETQARQARIRRAQILQSATNTGVQQSSGTFGAMNYIAGEVATGSSTLLTGEVGASALTRSNQKAQDLVTQAQTAQQVSSIAAGIAGTPGAAQTLRSAGTQIKSLFT